MLKRDVKGQKRWGWRGVIHLHFLKVTNVEKIMSEIQF